VHPHQSNFQILVLIGTGCKGSNFNNHTTDDMTALPDKRLLHLYIHTFSCFFFFTRFFFYSALKAIYLLTVPPLNLNLTICWLMTYWRSISTTIKQWQPWIVDIKIKCLDCYTFLSIKQDIDQVLYVDLYWIRRNYRRDYCHVRNVSVKFYNSWLSLFNGSWNRPSVSHQPTYRKVQSSAPSSVELPNISFDRDWLQR
jgi:hypothetical protein